MAALFPLPVPAPEAIPEPRAVAHGGAFATTDHLAALRRKAQRIADRLYGKRDQRGRWQEGPARFVQRARQNSARKRAAALAFRRLVDMDLNAGRLVLLAQSVDGTADFVRVPGDYSLTTKPLVRFCHDVFRWPPAPHCGAAIGCCEHTKGL